MAVKSSNRYGGLQRSDNYIIHWCIDGFYKGTYDTPRQGRDTPSLTDGVSLRTEIGTRRVTGPDRRTVLHDKANDVRMERGTARTSSQLSR